MFDRAADLVDIYRACEKKSESATRPTPPDSGYACAEKFTPLPVIGRFGAHGASEGWYPLRPSVNQDEVEARPLMTYKCALLTCSADPKAACALIPGITAQRS